MRSLPFPCGSCRPPTDRGSVAVELALALPVFLLIVLGTIEVARALYLINTVQDVTRSAARAAATTNFANKARMDAVKQRALFRDSDGALALVPELTTANVRVDYLSRGANGLPAEMATAPACPQANVVNCTANPNGASCIRYVRVRICAEADGACTPLAYRSLTGFVPELSAMSVPLSTTVVNAESLGYRAGEETCL
jgi:Flp pilus assembly protein TadG